jgi:hypothetical protein
MRFKTSRGANEWQAFVAVCKSQLAFNPQAHGLLAGANKLAIHAGPWHAVWERFSEAPRRYPNIPNRIRQCQPPLFDLFASAESVGGWPQWNEDAGEGRYSMICWLLNHLPAHEAGSGCWNLRRPMHPRRELVWAELGEVTAGLGHQALWQWWRR